MHAMAQRSSGQRDRRNGTRATASSQRDSGQRGSGQRDSSGRRLKDYPHPSVASTWPFLASPRPMLLPRCGCCSCAAPTRWPAGVAAPGRACVPANGWPRPNRRCCMTSAGWTGAAATARVRRPGRDPRGWVIWVAHAATVRYASLVSGPTCGSPRPSGRDAVRPRRDRRTVHGRPAARYASSPTPTGSSVRSSSCRPAAAARGGRRPALAQGRLPAPMEPHLVP